MRKAAAAFAVADLAYHLLAKRPLRKLLGLHKKPGRLQCELAGQLRRAARYLDDYPVEFMGPVHGENGTTRLPGPRLRRNLPSH